MTTEQQPSALDSIAELLGTNPEDSEEDIHNTYAPPDASYDDVLEGFAQAAQEMRKRGLAPDIEQSNYLPEEEEDEPQPAPPASFPNQFDTPEKIQNGISWLNGEVAQLNQALQNNIINQAQYEQGMQIATHYAQTIQAAVLNAEKSMLEAQKQEARAHAYIAEHIPEWRDEGAREGTVKQMYNFLNSQGFTNDVIERLPHTPEMAIFVYKLMKQHQRVAQAESKFLRKLNKPKQPQQPQRKPAPGNMLQKADAIADLLVSLGGV